MNDLDDVKEVASDELSQTLPQRVRLYLRQYQEILSLKLFLKYVVSGVSSVMIQYVTLIQLVEIFHTNETLSSSVAFLIGCLVNYLLLYYWTFRSNGRHHDVLVRYITVTILTFGINLVLFWVLTEVFSVWYVSAQVFATCFVALINFILYNKYTFSV